MNENLLIKNCNTDGTIISDNVLRKYLTGFNSSFGYVYLSKTKKVFFTDSRYFESAKKIVKNFEVVCVSDKSEVFSFIKSQNLKTLSTNLDLCFYNDYCDFIKLADNVCDCSKEIERIMSVKSQSEIENIEKSVKIAEKSFIKTLSRIKEGILERELSAELEYNFKKFGAEGVSFETICAFGKNSSVPHHETDNTKLKFGDMILMDFGCKYNGYCSDITRTFLFGNDKSEKTCDFIKKYDILLETQKLCVNEITSDMTGIDADKIAREKLKKYNLDKYFTHSLGHGIGLNIHEYPYLSRKGEKKLQNGMVFSIEPGIYFEDYYGIRIEDTVTLDNGKIKNLVNIDKNLLIL